MASESSGAGALVSLSPRFRSPTSDPGRVRRRCIRSVLQRLEAAAEPFADNARALRQPVPLNDLDHLQTTAAGIGSETCVV